MKKVLLAILYCSFAIPSIALTLFCKTDGYVGSRGPNQTSFINKREAVSVKIENERIEIVNHSTQSKSIYKIMDKHDDGYVGVYVPQSNQYLQPNLVDSVVITLSYKRIVRTFTASDGAEVYAYHCL
jgi:hypothetical protein